MRVLIALFNLVCIAAAGFAVYLYLFHDEASETSIRDPAASGSAEGPSSANPDPAGQSAPEPEEAAVEPENTHAAATDSREQPGDSAPREPLETVRFDLPVARAAGKLEADGTTIRLAGLDALGPDETCESENGEEWPCGHAAMHALRRLIRGRSVVCDIVERPAPDTATGRCTVAKIDINEWLVRRGWARPAEGNGAYDAVLEAARRDRNGQWRDAPPWEN